MAKRAKVPAPETGMIRAVDPSSSEEPTLVRTADARISPTLSQRAGRFFRFLLRAVLVLILLAAIGVGLYFGAPLLYQRYVVPVEQNTAGMVELQSRQQQTEQQLADMQTKLQTLETVQNRHDQSLTELDERIGEIQTEIAARTASLESLEEIQAGLRAQDEAVSAELERQINLLKAMELLSRAQLFMYQSNFGTARQDVQIARDVLTSTRPDARQPLAAELDAVLVRLDMVLDNLPDFPVAASDDLDIAWQILLSGLPQATQTPATILTPSVTSVPTLTPNPTSIIRPSATP